MCTRQKNLDNWYTDSPANYEGLCKFYVNVHNLSIVFIRGIKRTNQQESFESGITKKKEKKTIRNVFLNDNVGARFSYVVLFKVAFLA